VGGGAAAAGPLGVDEYREVASQVTSDGLLQLTDLKRGKVLGAVPIEGLNGATVTRVADTGAGKYLVGTSKYMIGTSDGRVIPLEIKFDATFPDGKREIVAQPKFGAPSLLDPERKRPILDVATAASESGPVTVARVGPSDVVLQSVTETKALVGGGRREESIAGRRTSSSGRPAGRWCATTSGRRRVPGWRKR
jgi:hypothetical protein